MNLGGFQQAARELTRISGKNYSRQAVQGLWGRRLKTNSGFPELHTHTINGKEKHYFDLDEITHWYQTRRNHHA